MVRWYSEKGDSTLAITKNGTYSVKVRNAIATELKLLSDFITETIVAVNLFSSHAGQAGNIAVVDLSTTIIPVKINAGNAALTIYPNPVKTILIIQMNIARKETVVLQVADMAGKILLQQQLQLNEGNNTVKLNTSSLAVGSYMLVLKGSNTSVKQFLKE